MRFAFSTLMMTKPSNIPYDPMGGTCGKYTFRILPVGNDFTLGTPGMCRGIEQNS